MELHLRETDQESASHLQDLALEQVRLGNPAARSLPLLKALATGDSERVIVSLLESQQLVLDIDSCRH